MSPRARRSESITSPPANQPGLVRYNDEKTYPSEKCEYDPMAVDTPSESELDSASDDSYDPNDSDDSISKFIGLEQSHGR